MASGSVDAPLMLFAASFLICFGLLLFVDRADLAARNAEAIGSLAVFYGRRATQRAATASTPRTMVSLSVAAVSMGGLSLVILFFRLDVPLSALSVWLVGAWGAVQVLVAVGLFSLRMSRFRFRENVARRTRSLRISALIAGVCGVVTLASLAFLLAARTS